MKAKLARLQTLAANQYAKAGALVTMGLMASGAHAAEGDNPLTTLFDAVDLSGISTKVLAMGVIIVGIAIAFKGPSLVKRIIGKI